MIVIILLIFGVQGQSMSQYNTSDPIDMVYWCGIEQNGEGLFKVEVMFALSNQGRVYKSMTHGLRWVDESAIFNKMGIDDSFYDILTTPANPQMVYMFGNDGNGIKSEDCGNHYSAFRYPKSLYDFKFNSMDDEWILAMDLCMECIHPFNKDLYATIDGGTTWKLVLSGVHSATWDKLIDSELIPDERIIVSHLNHEDNTSMISYSDDYFKTSKVLHINGTWFHQTQYHMFVASKLEIGYQLWVAPAFLDMSELRPILLPFQETYSFTLLDTDSDQIFLSVSHNASNLKVTNIYTSDYQGLKFTLSLLNNVRSLDTGYCDFDKVLSLKGVFIVNVYDHAYKGDQPDKFRRSLISFDKGGVWHPLKAPDMDSNNQPLHCNGDCSLHLQGRSVSKIQSDAKAIGIIVAMGNIGTYLNDKECNTYLSRDGGHSWHEIRKGAHVLVIGDRGGLIVMSRADTYTDEILYSWDEGLTWQNIKIDTMEVKFIVNRGMYQSYTIIGQYSDGSGTMITIDFLKLHPRICSGVWDPSDPDSDYEMWIPRNFDNGKCLFGQKFKYVRRKREAQCFNQQEYDKTYFVDTCECTNEDWECDYGYYRKIDGGRCVPIATMFEEDDIPDLEKQPEDCNGTYIRSQGYRKIVGDYCQNGINLGPIELPCLNITESSTANIQVQQIITNQPTPEQTIQSTYIQSAFTFIITSIAFSMLLCILCRQKEIHRQSHFDGHRHRDGEQISLFSDQDV